MLVETLGIVVNSRKYSDSSKIIHVFTKEHGMVSLIAKGAFSKSNRFGGSLEPFTLGMYYFNKKTTQSLYTLSKSEIVDTFMPIRNSMVHTATALCMVETIKLILEEEQSNHKLWDFALLGMKLLEKAECNPQNILIRFLLRCSSAIGYKLKLNLNLENLNINEVSFSLSEDTFYQHNTNYESNIIKLNSESLIILQSIANSEPENIEEINMDIKIFTELYNFICRYMSFHIGKKIELKSFSLYSI